MSHHPPEQRGDGLEPGADEPLGWTESGLDDGLAAAFAAPATALQPTPERLGPYAIHGILGEGGMGRVFDASEDFPPRRIALKVLRPGMATSQLIQRFEREALLLGRLQHPGIARVHAAGVLDTEDGRVPYLAMERIEGAPLDEWLSAEDPDRRTRIELVARIADAIHHAHVKGVVHRDLKPSNVLVDAEGRPSVVDFGIACAIGQDTIQGLRTAAGQFLGTLPFMAPEQIASDGDPIDARTDVYGLGCLLYNTLCGELPLDVAGGNLATAVHAILERPPTPLREHDPSLGGDLDVIATKALEKEPEARYDSASALAADLRRHLAFEPILARPTTAMYQLSRLARRHRVSFGLAVGLLLALVLGLAGTIVQARRATEGQRLAEAERDNKAAINQILLTNLANSSPFHRGAPTRAADNLREIERQLEAVEDDDPLIEVPLRIGLAKGYRELGLLDEAERNAERARALIAVDDTATPIDRLRVQVETGRLLLERSDLEAGRAALELAHEHALDLLGPDHLDTLGIEEALLYARLQLEDAEEVVVDATELYERTRALLGERASQTILALNVHASALSYTGRLHDSVALFRESARLCEEVYGPLHGQTLAAQSNLASMLSWSGQTDEATALLERTVHDADRFFGDDSWVLRQLMQVVGENHSNAGRYGQAAETLAEASRLCGATVGPAHPETLMCRDQYAIALRRSLRLEEALAEFQAVLALREETLGIDHKDVGGSWAAIAITLDRLERFDDALAAFDRSREVTIANHGRAFHNTLWTDASKCRLLLRVNRSEEAAALMEEVVPLRADLVGTSDPTYLAELRLLGDAYLASGRPEDARDAYATCIETNPSTSNPWSWEFALRWDLIRCLDAIGQIDKTRAALDELETLLGAEGLDPDNVAELTQMIAGKRRELEPTP